jgi:hypothetical protein
MKEGFLATFTSADDQNGEDNCETRDEAVRGGGGDEFAYA